MTEAYKKSKYIAIIKVFGIGTLKMKMLNVFEILDVDVFVFNEVLAFRVYFERQQFKLMLLNK